MGAADCLIVIPARWGSQRLPGKPLHLLAGEPMIGWVVKAALKVRNARGVVVATDHPEIAAAAREAGAIAVLTGTELRNGTERLLAVINQHPAQSYVNLQSDEPLIAPSDIEELIHALEHSKADVVSLRHAINAHQAEEASRVKVVCNSDRKALYFSRSPIPHGAEQFWQHVGVYGFQASALERIRGLSPTALEEQESLEQLRWLEAGLCIEILESKQSSLGVDTAAEAQHVDQILRLRQIKVLICDVDGVLTDGRLWYSSEGEELKAFHARDGLAIKLLIKQGIQVALVSGRDSKALQSRIADLGIKHACLGEADKAKACAELQHTLNLSSKQMAYVGDDTLDLPGMAVCGWSFAVADAPLTVKQSARQVLQTRGGYGAIREITEILLNARNEQAILEQSDAFQSTGLHQEQFIQ